MIKSFTVHPVLNGFLVGIGCQQVVFDSRVKLLVAIGEYLERPVETEEKFLKEAVNPMSAPRPNDPPMPCGNDQRITASEIGRRAQAYNDQSSPAQVQGRI